MTQLVLPKEPLKLDDTIVSRPRDMLRAFITAADLAGYDDKQAAASLGMDPATWSRFKQGDVGVKPNQLNNMLDQFGNELPLAYWAYTRGYVLIPRESEMQRRLRLKDEEVTKLKDENRLLRSIAAGKVE